MLVQLKAMVWLAYDESRYEDYMHYMILWTVDETKLLHWSEYAILHN